MHNMYSKINAYLDPSALLFGVPTPKYTSALGSESDYGSGDYMHSSTWSNNSSQEKPLRFIVIRHGERVDVMFGAGWTQRAFGYGYYMPFDPNMPQTLIPRANWQDYDVDTPLTAKGLSQS